MCMYLRHTCLGHRFLVPPGYTGQRDAVFEQRIGKACQQMGGTDALVACQGSQRQRYPQVSLSMAHGPKPRSFRCHRTRWRRVWSSGSGCSGCRGRGTSSCPLGAHGGCTVAVRSGHEGLDIRVLQLKRTASVVRTQQSSLTSIPDVANIVGFPPAKRHKGLNDKEAEGLLSRSLHLKASGGMGAEVRP